MSKVTTIAQRLQKQKELLKDCSDSLALIEGAQILLNVGFSPAESMRQIVDGVNKYCEATEAFIREVNGIANFFDTDIELKKELTQTLPLN